MKGSVGAGISFNNPLPQLQPGYTELPVSEREERPNVMHGVGVRIWNLTLPLLFFTQVILKGV